MNRETKLLPCPFCGNEAHKITYSGPQFQIACVKCGAAREMAFVNFDSAVNYWNTRHSPAPPLPDDLSKAIEDKIKSAIDVVENGLSASETDASSFEKSAWILADTARKYLTAAKRSQELQEQLKQEMIWKEEDPRMLREQIRVHDVAFQHLHEQHKSLEHRSQEQAALIEKYQEALRRIATQFPNDDKENPNALARLKCEQAKESLVQAQNDVRKQR